MYQFGMPNRIITDLGSPFIAIKFRSWAQDCSISINYASIAHPHADGQVERANGLLLARLKSRLFDELKDYDGKWIYELPKVVWGLRTQQSRVTRYSPFFLVYGSEDILPTYLIGNSPRVEQYNEGEVDETRRLEIDTAEEIKLNTLFQSTRYLQGLRHHYDKNVHPHTFQVGDLVLKRIQNTLGCHKLLSP